MKKINFKENKKLIGVIVAILMAIAVTTGFFANYLAE